jgi:CRISPR-associated protein Cst1
MYKVYLRDWYFNSGIVGFLNVLSERTKNIDEIKSKLNGKIKIEDNYLEFDSEVLQGFYENYKKLAFDIFFDINNYRERINNLIRKIQQSDTRVTKQLLNDTALSGKIVNRFIKDIYNKDLNNIISENKENKGNLLLEIQKLQDRLDQYRTNIDVYNDLIHIKSDFIEYFLNNKLSKKVCDYKKVEGYIDKLKHQTLPAKKDAQRCYICGELKKEYDFSNAITQILGVNSDNSNWIWGFQPSKAKICSLCALIYSCAVHGMIFLNRKIDRDYKTYFYALNRNTDISTLYHSFWLFKEKINQKENQNKPFYILQEVIVELIQQQSRAVLENINFIEIEENKFGGQSTKGYNVYNYNITKELAEFIKTMRTSGIPKGFYKDRDFYSDITEEILKKTLEHTLSFSDLARYVEYFIRSHDPNSRVSVQFSISKVSNYILKYITKVKGGDTMAQEQIVNKAFNNGKLLGENIRQENKIKGVAYQLLNDLKIGDRNSFMDKYLRLSMHMELK